MKIFKSFRLLTKTTFFYLIFVFIAFYVSAHYLIYKANQYVKQETEYIFDRREWHLTQYLQDHDSLKSFRTTHISVLKDLNDTINYPQYSDTTIYIEELGVDQLHRKKIFFINAKEEVYLVRMLVNIDDFTKLKQDIAHRINPAFILLAFVIILFSMFMSGYLLKPFHRILDKMNKYKVGEGIDISDVKTSTLEFKKMQLLFNRMIKRTEGDYKKLKEYTENMAHEIQTPLTIIRNKTEHLIADELVMKSHENSVKVIYDETNHLSKLGNTLNLLTKIENGEYTNRVNLNTLDVIQKHIESIQELIELKSLTIETDLLDNHTIYIDPFLFDIILKNLFRNALRYSTNEGPIKVKTTHDCFQISNYGKELSSVNVNLFERFYTSDKSNQSLGLGLALVKRICDLNRLFIEHKYVENQHVFEIRMLE
jgi:signal transduction histidine kinase